MKRLGFEQPEQLGALFIGDAEYLKELTAGSPPLVDNDPKLIEARSSSQENANRLFESITDVTAARKRFQNSPLIKHLWPERVVAASLPYFEFQEMINIDLYHNQLHRSHGMEDIHRLLTRSPLSTLVLWRLGSDPDVQKIIAEAGPEELKQPMIQLHLGIGLVSERKFAEAAEHLYYAQELPGIRRPAFGLQIYALCMSGQIHEAQRLVRAAQVSTEKGAPDVPMPFWIWMKNTFGLDVIVPDRAPQN
jgi:hypothetical protein